jgi:hypothetical protein
MNPEAPTAAELGQHPIVQAAFAAAWADSMAEDPVQRHEEGGYIYADAKGDVIVRSRETMADRFKHTTCSSGLLPRGHVSHSSDTNRRGGNPDASPDDRECADDSGVPWFVISELGIASVGPDCRVGGMTGAGGYPQ